MLMRNDILVLSGTRDARVSSPVDTGWGDYTSSASSASPQIIPANTDTKLDFETVSQSQELPQDYASTGMYDLVNDVILGRPGDGILITIEFAIRRQSGSGTFNVETFIDIGGAVGELYNQVIQLPGTGDRNNVSATGAYTLDTWAENGGSIFVSTSVATEIFDKRVLIHRIHKGKGTY